MPGPAVPRQQPGGPPGRPGAGAASAVPPALWNGPSTDSLPVADDWAWDDSNWDPAASLTAQEIAALAALDRAGQPADDWEDFPGDAALRSGLIRGESASGVTVVANWLTYLASRKH